MSETLDAGTRRANDSTSESPKLVQMDRVPGGEVASLLHGTKQGQSSWLEEFLVNAGRNYNPFEPKAKIRISLFDDDDKEK